MSDKDWEWTGGPPDKLDIALKLAQLTFNVLPLVKKINKLEKIARQDEPTHTGYNNDPAVVEKLAILITKVIDLEAKIITHPPPPPAAPKAPPAPPCQPPPQSAVPQGT